MKTIADTENFIRGQVVEAVARFAPETAPVENERIVRTREIEAALSRHISKPEERQKAGAALRDGGELFRTLGGRSPVGIWLVDCAGECRYASAGWTAISGFSAEQTLGRGWVRTVHPDDRAMVLQGWMAFTSEPFAREFRVRCPDGSVRWVFLQSAVIGGESEGLLGRIATVEDITERKEAMPAV
jgi:PAS domain S-box-containing protein